ncbi:MAG: DUF5916 domain-containing protein [Spirosomataceae bacterium]
MKKFIISLLGILVSGGIWAQKKNEKYQYHIHRAASAITIDGKLDEPTWQSAELASDFYMVLPMDTSAAKLRTEVKMAYDERFIYISAVNYQSNGIVVESLRRDWNFGKNDNFIFFLDTFDDQTNGFTFGANAAGAQWDGQQYDGGSANLNWDNRWFSEVRQYPDRWVFEAAIPFKTIRYKAGITRWGVNFSRNDLKSTEKSVWAPVPRQFPTASLAYTGILVWDQPPPIPGPNISVIPYVLGGLSRDFQQNSKSTFRRDVGLDAKVAITPSLNLDLTMNPDFSQVEVDRQQTNLDRFELFFPERRQFFLENADLFNNLGLDRLRPFFSRRIGLGGVPINFGARLSGKIDKNWRIGVMDMQTGSFGETALPAQNFGVFSVQRQVFARSNITAYFINKQSIDYTPEAGKPVYSQYNRNAGIEYNLASQNNVWRGKLMYLKSFSPGASNDDYILAGNLSYNDRKWSVSLQYENVGKNYTAEVGYIPRRGYYRLTPTISRNFFPRGKWILSHGPGLMSYTIFDKPFNSIENENAVFYAFTFRSRSTFTIWTGQDYVKLQSAFDPTNLTGIQLVANSEHNWLSWGTEYISKPQSLFTYGFSSRYGGYYADGTRLRLTTDLAYRFQPYGSIALSAEYNNIQFPSGKGLKNASFWLISPRLDITFTNKIYFTTFVQYNEQAKNINLNTRFQWRYAPASDLYIVYTDNYLPENLQVKSRALVLKMTYWWNL